MSISTKTYNALITLLDLNPPMGEDFSLWKHVFNEYSNRTYSFRNEKIWVTRIVSDVDQWSEQRDTRVILCTNDTVFHARSGTGGLQYLVYRPGLWERYVERLADKINTEHVKIDDHALFTDVEI